MPVLPTPGFSLQPNTKPTATPGSYLTSSDFTWLQQYLPDTYEAEFERYGNRSVSSFLRLVGAELPSNSDMITWAEQGRLHIKYRTCTLNASPTNTSGTYTITGTDAVNMSFRPGATIILQVNDTGATARGIVTAISQSPLTFTVSYYDAPATITSLGLATAGVVVTAFIYGSEFRKGIGATTSGTAMGSLDASDKDQFFTNNPIILKDKFIVSGSDMAQIGWVQVDTEDGATGYLWYLKSASDTRLRFDDYLETSMLEAIPAAGSSGAAALSLNGTKGVFYEINNRGNVWGTALPATITDWDSVVKRLDAQGAIEENALFVNRDMSFAIDNFLAALNGFPASGTAGGASFGLFDNDVNMALNLGFSGFRRGYDFYKSDWKYLNDVSMRGNLYAGGIAGNLGTIFGLLVPAGTTNVYDQVMGRNAKRPFLHVRYRASETEDRRYKTWVTGSAGGAATNDIDNMEVNFLSERCVCVLGANNFMLFRYGA